MQAVKETGITLHSLSFEVQIPLPPRYARFSNLSAMNIKSLNLTSESTSNSELSSLYGSSFCPSVFVSVQQGLLSWACELLCEVQSCMYLQNGRRRRFSE